jgi:predicted RNase H-like nuclease (RuvC/YqgF family)
MYELEPLLTEIATLLDQDEGRDDPAQIERTLTDGYAQALTLEAERSDLERRVLRLSLELDENGDATLREVKELARQLHDCDDSVERLRGELVRLKRRHSQALHGRPGWAT